MRWVMRGGTVVDGGMRIADVAVDAGRIAQVGEVAPRVGDQVIDCSGRLVLPGLVDAHSHADALARDPAVQRSLLRQGVTTVVAGQDGVSFAPGDGRYASEYFAAINGEHPSYRGGGVAAFLADADTGCRVNTAYLVPAGTVRWEACGRASAPASTAQLDAMVGMVDEGMRAGAVGLSSGLDYVPGIFASATELAELCAPVAASGGVYASHMRGGYEANSAAGIEEIAQIARASGVRAHVSHFHAEAAIVIAQMDALARAGVDATFDAYPYTRGCSLLSMPLLPPELAVLPADEVVGVLRDAGDRARLRREWFPQVAAYPSLGTDWPAMITLAHIDAADFAWAHGLTLAEASARAGRDAVDFSLDLLAVARLRVNVIMAVRYPRPITELARIFADPRHMGGSDGIFIGAHPHPRARGTFARYLREYVRETGTWSWPDAARHLSTAPAARFSLGRRGRVSVGWIADLAVVDPDAVSDTATYEHPLGEAVGVDDVLVAGVPVLRGGELTDETPGRGIRREPTGA